MPKKTTKKNNLIDLQTLSSLSLARMNMAVALGQQQFGGDRDIYTALGYKTTDPTFSDYYVRYDRQDIAKAIIDKPVNATWRGGIKVLESDDNKVTVLEKGFDDLERKHRLVAKFNRLDRLTGIGSYGVLLLGINDINDQREFVNPVSITNSNKLLYTRPLSEKSASITEYEENTASERYGLPRIYEITLTSPDDATKSSIIHVHHSRIIHVADGLLENEVVGTPRLKAIFNRLMDLVKVVGGSGEMFWRGARPGYAGKIDKDFQITDTVRDALQDQMDEYDHNLRRFLMLKGIDIEALGMQVANPKDHFDVIIQLICAVMNIPKRKLFGSERGELSSIQDDDSWNDTIQERRESFAEPMIVRPFIDRMIDFKILPESKNEDNGYSIKWTDLSAQTEKERAEIGERRAKAIESYAKSVDIHDIIPPEAFVELFLNLTPEQVEQLKEIQKNAFNQERGDFEG